MKRKYRSWTAFLMLGVMFCLSGCSGSFAGREREQENPASAGDSTGVDTGMGRYLEKEVVLPEEVTDSSDYPQACLQQLENGDLALLGNAAGLYVSSDNGETWIQKPAPWYVKLRENAWISRTALAPDGSAAVIYAPYEDADSGEDGAEGEEPEEQGTGEESQDEADGYRPEYLYADPNGNVKKLKAPDPENWLDQFWFGRDSRLYACDMDGKVYEMDVENGTAKKLFETEGLSEYVCFTGRYLFMVTSRNEAILYDLENGMMAETDRVLQEFVRNTVGNAVRSNGEGYGLAAASGEQEDVLYLAYSGGLYRHVIGGSAMEQLSDGSMSSLGDPQRYLCGFAALPDNEFLILYDRAKLYRYVYDPDIPAVPEEQIRIYSLKDDYTLRQAVSLFRKIHPEIYVRYEVGIPADGSMTSEDAVKKLNTELLSGSGPDLLMLDGLPYVSYAEKGVLTDLSGIVHNMAGESSLFQNLVDSCRTDGRLYYLPIRFRLPLLVGDRESIGKVTDLDSLAGAVETLRKEYPEGALIGLRTEEEVLRTLALTCSGAWTDPVSKKLKEEKLTEFLQSARRIWQAETAGLDEEELLDYQENYRENWQSDVAGEGMYYALASANAVDVAMETQKLGAGTTCRVDGEFNIVTTLAGQEEDFGYVPWKGQISNGFLPRCMMGICAGSKEKVQVLEFFRFLYGSELQDLDLPSGFPINQESFEKQRINPREGMQETAGIVLVDGTGGDLFALDIQWCQEEDFERLKAMAQSASSVCSGDARIEQIVCELGVKAVNGSAGVEDTVIEIRKKAAMILAE